MDVNGDGSVWCCCLLVMVSIGGGLSVADYEECSRPVDSSTNDAFRHLSVMVLTQGSGIAGKVPSWRNRLIWNGII